jgi:hypothetical protein
MIEISLLVFLVVPFALFSVKHVWHNRSRINVCTVLIIDIRNPINHTDCFGIDIYLKTISVIKLVYFGLNLGGSPADCKNAVGHFKVQRLPFCKTLVFNKRIDIVALIAKGGKQQHHKTTRDPLSHVHEIDYKVNHSVLTVYEIQTHASILRCNV